MKRIIYLAAFAILLSACGGKEQSVESVISTNNIAKIKEKKAAIEKEQEVVTANLQMLKDALAELDTVKKIPLISTFLAKQEVFNHYVELQGNVTTKNLLTITPEMSGILKTVTVKEGQRVSKGQTLAILDDGGIGQELAQLQIQADLAKTTFERQERLWEQKIGSEMDFLQAKSNYNAQSKAINQLQQQLAKTVVKAPFSGVIDDVITEPGNVTAAGQTPLFLLVNLNRMYIETDVPESHISNIKKNKAVLVDIPVLNKEISTKVAQVGSYINPANRTFKIEVNVPNPDKTIKPNLTAKLKINDYTSENAVLIPQSIISENAKGQQYIYVLKNKENNHGEATRVIIKTGKTQDDLIEVLSGIEVGEEIIQEGARTVKNGQTVEVINS
ncbi:efflux RND transporter periplasmic adaptor subunit [Maribacter sp.]|uniref:efflux RND transporter periplasmic adaptor subunit n=1 Tax=Maribacter sp. TaxID=1897614 RepID=UPI0025BC97D4|nr:efflux RND transporter periplasmic adaptor subunit [Maribacter sp.]